MNPQGNDVRNYFLHLDRDEQDREVIEIIDYLEENNFSAFPYNFLKRYKPDDIKCYYDKECGMCFVLHKGKKMYLPRSWNMNKARWYYNMLCSEQDAASPHRYETKAFTVREGDVIVDIGAAEGIWALSYAEKAAKIYLFECENEWIEALQKTFEPWKEKTVIEKKYVSATDSGEFVSIDGYFKDKEINFIKADIEGAEREMLEGGKNKLSMNGRLSLLICAYHRHDDGKVLKELCEKYGFKTEYSPGYMLFTDRGGGDKIPYMRRGLIRASKE